MEIQLVDSDGSVVAFTAVRGGWTGDGIVDADQERIERVRQNAIRTCRR